MKRFIALFLSTAVTVLLVIAVLAAGQPRAQANTPQTAPVAASAPALTTDAVQSAPASDAFALPQFETGHHEGNEHHHNNTPNLSLSDD
jgi:hypothetical protein